MELPIQEGLLPLGLQEGTQLWDFWHPQSGEKPSRDESGDWKIEPGTSLVFTLIPGGGFHMGAQDEDELEFNYDPNAIDDSESPVRELEILPYFLSRFEMTRGQWLRLTGRDPSSPKDPTEGGLKFPVNNVSWNDCFSTLTDFGLTLPTEEQWERAARAETETIWWTGNDPKDLAQHANLGDAKWHDKDERFLDQPYEDWNDGWASPSPVGYFPPNPFGLHDIHGNMFEWCLHEAYDYETEQVDSPIRRVCRGGGFMQLAFAARLAYRERFPDTQNESIGCRPARAIILD